MRKPEGFTLTELLVAIAVIVSLTVILIPALQQAGEQGKRLVCLSNIRQLQLAWVMYADEFDGRIVNGAANSSTNPRARIPSQDGSSSAARETLAKSALYACCPSLRISSARRV